jgi:hypothetical protein
MDKQTKTVTELLEAKRPDTIGVISVTPEDTVLTEVYRQRDLPPAANCGRVVGVMTSVVLAQAALRPADASTWAA